MLSFEGTQFLANTVKKSVYDQKNKFLWYFLASFFLFLGFNQVNADVLNPIPADKIKLRVGVLNTPPYSYFFLGKPTGISYDIWEVIALENQLDCEYVEIGGFIDDAIEQVRLGKLDMAMGFIPQLSYREKVGYFTLAYFRSQFVLVAKKAELSFVTRLYDTFKNIPLYWLVIFIFLYVTYMFLFYFCERKAQSEIKELSPLNALELMFWRSLISGLRSPPFFPSTRPARMISLVWTLIITVLTFSFIAGFTSVFMTAWSASGKQISHLSDLDGKPVDVASGQVEEYYLHQLGLTMARNDKGDLTAALSRLENNETSAIFMSRLMALNMIRTHPEGKLYIAEIPLPSYDVSYFFNDKYLYLLRAVNYSILRVGETGEKESICKKYLGNTGAQLCK